jgi:hypothetical protein
LTIAPNTSGAARQQFLNPRELIAAQSITILGKPSREGSP